MLNKLGQSPDPIPKSDVIKQFLLNQTVRGNEL